MYHLLLQRLITAATALPTPTDCAYTTLILMALAAFALPFGWRTGFLRWEVAAVPPLTRVGTLLATFFVPALSEETLFRVLILPESGEHQSLGTFLIWAALGLVAFVLWHPLQTWLLPPHKRVFSDWRFLVLACLLGVACSAAYLLTSSLWPPTVLHRIYAAAWLLRFGGYGRVAVSKVSE